MAELDPRIVALIDDKDDDYDPYVRSGQFSAMRAIREALAASNRVKWLGNCVNCKHQRVDTNRPSWWCEVDGGVDSGIHNENYHFCVVWAERTVPQSIYDASEYVD